MIQPIRYSKGHGITVKGTHYPSFSRACKQYDIPRQQCLRAFNSSDLRCQDDVDSFFDRMQSHYQSEQYLTDQAERQQFKDGRASPVKFRSHIFRSKEQLALHLNTSPNPFKTRLNYLESCGVIITDNIVQLCANPLHKSVFNVDLSRELIAERLSENYSCTISKNKLDEWINAKDCCIDLPLTVLAPLFNVQYETLKRQVYDTKFTKKPSKLDVLGALSMLRPNVNTPLSLNDIEYPSLFSLMVECSYKLSKTNVQPILAKYTASIKN